MSGHSEKGLEKCKYGPTLGGLPIRVQRNFFGRQVDSFISPLKSSHPSLDGKEGVFIRAPAILELLDKEKTSEDKKNRVEILATVTRTYSSSDNEEGRQNEAEINVNDKKSRREEESVIVACRKKNIFATCFHPELGEEIDVHEYFLEELVGWTKKLPTTSSSS